MKREFSRSLRAEYFDKLRSEAQDVLVVGGGINGAVALAACAKAGLKCALAEAGDFASETSQASSNLIWGGIKYLENMEFPLVYKLCRSRNRLMRRFPSSIREIRFLTLHRKGFRFPLWFLYAGGWAYQAIGQFATRAPRYLGKGKMMREAPRVNPDGFDGAFEYSDAILPENDSRFVFGFVQKGVDAGALAVNHCRLTKAEFAGGIWRCEMKAEEGTVFTVEAKSLINAAGPYADFLNRQTGIRSSHRHIFSKGIHLIFPKFEERNRVIASFADDGRLFFVIPMGERVCVGTTDTRVETPETEVTEEDRDFLLGNINRIFRFDSPLDRSDVISERCGVRPLVVENAAGETEGDWFKLSRKHFISVDEEKKSLSLFGGKLTDCLNIGEEILELLEGRLGFPIRSRNLETLGEPSERERERFLAQCEILKVDVPDQPKEAFRRRLWRRYYDRHEELLEMLEADRDLLRPLAEGVSLYRFDEEMAYRFEMAYDREDFLRRRTLGAMNYTRQQLDSCVFTRF